METENFAALHASADPVSENQDDSSNNGTNEADSEQATSNLKGEKLMSEKVEHMSDVQQKELDGLAANPEENSIDCDSDMEVEDLSAVPALKGSSGGFEKDGIHYRNYEPSQAGCQSGIPADQGTQVTSESLVKTKDNYPCEDGSPVPNPSLGKNSVDNCPILQVNADLTEISVIKTMKSNSISGVKRTRMMFDEQNPSVCIKYNSLTRSSKRKLEELLQQWSEWHARHSSSVQAPDEDLESGEETFFPALHVGLEKASSVSFWMDQQPRKQQNNELIPLDHKSVPMYDRSYALGLTSDDGTSNIERGLEIVDDAARCFNCGSYSHALRDCQKPRDNAAVNNARKQLKSKRNQNSGSRNQTRYYQNSPAGKYDGLRPGALDPETRKLLGLGELDPPPWLNRMREIGYPPGYLDPDEEVQPSGISIFADGEIKEEQEDGEIVDTLSVETPKPEPKRKMSVEFPGINGPIPKNADERLWADVSGTRFHRRSSTNHSSEPISRAHHHYHHHHRDERWPRSEFRDEGPPGVAHGLDPAMSIHLPRYSNDSSYNSHSPRLNLYGRLEPDWPRRSRFPDEGLYSSSPQHFSRHSPTDYGSSRHANWVEQSRSDYDFDHWAHSSRDRQDRYRHLSRR